MEKQLDERRTLYLPGNHLETIEYATTRWIESAKRAISDHGFFAVALSGGSTPKKIFSKLSSEHRDTIDWSKVHLFWSDERSVDPHNVDSNYHMAMTEGGLSTLDLNPDHIHRMVAEKDIEQEAIAYAKLIQETQGEHPFDLVMLGMGDDGHTASLFPHTKALQEEKQLVVANEVPQKETWRMTFTYPLINQAKESVLYVLGSAKKEVLEKVLFGPFDKEMYPSQNIGTKKRPASWIIDQEAVCPSIEQLSSPSL